MRAPSARKLGEAIREVAESGATRHGDNSKCGSCDAGACVQAVQKQD